MRKQDSTNSSTLTLARPRSTPPKPASIGALPACTLPRWPATCRCFTHLSPIDFTIPMPDRMLVQYVTIQPASIWYPGMRITPTERTDMYYSLGIVLCNVAFAPQININQ
ncbi:hypothetical protein JOE11_004499 [Robbsia andropogonis]